MFRFHRSAGELSRRLPAGNIRRVPNVLTLWNTARRLPLGERVFSRVFAFKAPYFATIRPRFTVIEPDHAELVIPDRRRVHNHLGTVHAIALCNGLEAAMGALAEASIPRGKRWIPKGMEVAYTAKATRRHHLHRRDRPGAVAGDDPDVPVRVRGVDRDGTVVVEGVIRLWVTAGA